MITHKDLKVRREALGYTEKYIGHELGISKGAYSKIETGVNGFDGHIESLSKILGIPIEDFYDSEKEDINFVRPLNDSIDIEEAVKENLLLISDPEGVLLYACTLYLNDFSNDETSKNIRSLHQLVRASVVEGKDSANAKSHLDILFDYLPQDSEAWKCYETYKRLKESNHTTKISDDVRARRTNIATQLSAKDIVGLIYTGISKDADKYVAKDILGDLMDYGLLEKPRGKYVLTEDGVWLFRRFLLMASLEKTVWHPDKLDDTHLEYIRVEALNCLTNGSSNLKSKGWETVRDEKIKESFQSWVDEMGDQLTKQKDYRIGVVRSNGPIDYLLEHCSKRPCVIFQEGSGGIYIHGFAHANKELEKTLKDGGIEVTSYKCGYIAISLPNDDRSYKRMFSLLTGEALEDECDINKPVVDKIFLGYASDEEWNDIEDKISANSVILILEGEQSSTRSMVERVTLKRYTNMARVERRFLDAGEAKEYKEKAIIRWIEEISKGNKDIEIELVGISRYVYRNCLVAEYGSERITDGLSEKVSTSVFIAYESESLFYESSIEKIPAGSVVIFINDGKRSLTSRSRELVDKKIADGVRVEMESLANIEDPAEKRDSVCKWVRNIFKDEKDAEIILVGSRPREFMRYLIDEYGEDHVSKQDTFEKKRVSQWRRR